jgi:hypothetical protein
MELYLDDKIVDPEYFDDGTLEDAVRHVQEEHCADDQLVIALACNGSRLDSETMEAALAKPIPECEKLEIFTGTRAHLVTEAMNHCFDSLEQTERATEDIADRLDGENPADALRELGECMSIWGKIHEALAKSIEMLAINPETFTIGETPFMDALAKPKEVLLQVKEALEQKDNVLLADVLRYELCDATKTWLTIIDKIRSEAKKQ